MFFVCIYLETKVLFFKIVFFWATCCFKMFCWSGPWRHQVNACTNSHWCVCVFVCHPVQWGFHSAREKAHDWPASALKELAWTWMTEPMKEEQAKLFKGIGNKLSVHCSYLYRNICPLLNSKPVQTEKRKANFFIYLFLSFINYKFSL